MIHGIPYGKMIRLELICLVTFVSITTAIRVDWNTNSGPIIPPTSTPEPIPQRPYRAPAPVWEDQYDDIPNVNPYRYVLPPPSRPKQPTDNYLRSTFVANQQQHQQQQQHQNFYRPQQQQNYVPSLAVQYIPNVGFKYNAIATAASPSSPITNNKLYYLKENDIYDNQQQYNGKFNERYNAKLKKYKAYERIKQNYHTTPFQYHFLPLYQEQQLPFVHQAVQFRRQTTDQSNVESTQQNFYQQVPQQQTQQKTSPLNQTKPQTFPQPTQPSATNVGQQQQQISNKKSR